MSTIYQAYIAKEFRVGKRIFKTNQEVGVAKSAEKPGWYDVYLPSSIAPVKMVEATVKHLLQTVRNGRTMVPMAASAAPAKAESVHQEPVQKVDYTAKSVVADGYYTIEYADGTWKTIRIHRDTSEVGDFKGRTIASLLIGSDNETSYKGFAFLYGDRFRVWSKFANSPVYTDLLITLLNPEHAEAAGYAFALKSSRCRNCGRRLTVPASIHRGFGPSCAKKGN